MRTLSQSRGNLGFSAAETLNMSRKFVAYFEFFSSDVLSGLFYFAEVVNLLLSLEELYVSKCNPSINKITLELLRQYYDRYLIPNTYKFLINMNDELNEIILKFSEENFCHLLGIESTVKGNVPYRTLGNYKGINGWNNIKDESLTFDLLKGINKKKFNDNKSKLVFFYLIPRLLENAKVVDFNKELVDGDTRIECDLLFFDELQNAYVHLGIELDLELGFYVPRTFLIKKVTKNNKGTKFISNQIEVLINERIIITS